MGAEIEIIWVTDCASASNKRRHLRCRNPASAPRLLRPWFWYSLSNSQSAAHASSSSASHVVARPRRTRCSGWCTGPRELKCAVCCRVRAKERRDLGLGCRARGRVGPSCIEWGGSSARWWRRGDIGSAWLLVRRLLRARGCRGWFRLGVKRPWRCGKEGRQLRGLGAQASMPTGIHVAYSRLVLLSISYFPAAPTFYIAVCTSNSCSWFWISCQWMHRHPDERGQDYMYMSMYMRRWRLSTRMTV